MRLKVKNFNLIAVLAVFLIVFFSVAYSYGDSPFIDVPNDHWALKEIIWAKEKGITYGCNPPENNKYCPDDSVTRAQMAAFIIRAIEGEPQNYNPNPYFDDASPKDWFFKYVQRMRERGIAYGYSGTNLFGTGDKITREQMAAMLIRALVSEGRVEAPPSNYCSNGTPFVDVENESWSCH